MHRRSGNHRKRQLIGLVALVVACLIVDAFVPSTIRASQDDVAESVMMAVSLGVCIGQINLISIWAAIAPGQLVVRLPWALLLTVIMWGAICVGLRQGNFPTDDYYQVGIILVGAQFAAQIPLWLGAKFGTWRLASRNQRKMGVAATDTQFNILHMMVGTSLLAIALALFRFVISGEPVDWSLMKFDPEMSVILCAAVITNLVIVVPCIWLAFLPLSRLRRSLIGWSLFVLMISFIEDITLMVLLGPPAGFPMILLVTVLINLAQCAVVLFALLKLRRLGFRLVRTDTTLRGRTTTKWSQILAGG